VRRLLHHTFAAAGISALTAGAIAGTLTTGSVEAPSTAVAAPAAVSSVSAPSSVPVAVGADLERRAVRENRSTRRVELSTATAAGARVALLQKQHKAAAEKQEALEKKRKAEAKRRAKEKKERAEEAAKIKRQGYDPDSSSPKSIARQIMKNKYGWGGSEFSCYNKIIMRESAWKVHADNPTSSAYGIPQALPGSKMASAGPDWRNNPATQIKWGLGYVKSRYGTPCSAWGFKSSHGWY
jgi:Skp family chaperone for outer membrane proteins